MPAFLIPWLIKGAMVLALAGFVYALWYRVDHWCNSACTNVTEERDLLTASIKAAQQRATDLAILYADTLEKVDAALKVAEAERSQKFAALRDRATRAGANRSVVVSPESVRLWDESSRAGNGQETAPAGIGEERAAISSVSEADLNQFIVDAAAAYRAVNEARLACIALYEGTQ